MSRRQKLELHTLASIEMKWWKKELAESNVRLKLKHYKVHLKKLLCYENHEVKFAVGDLATKITLLTPIINLILHLLYWPGLMFSSNYKVIISNLWNNLEALLGGKMGQTCNQDREFMRKLYFSQYLVEGLSCPRPSI